MRTSCNQNPTIGRLLLAVGVVFLFAAAILGFSAFHHHDHATGQAPNHCMVCLTHATASTAIVSDAQVVVVALRQPATPFVAGADVAVSHAPLTADSRGPPAIL